MWEENSLSHNSISDFSTIPSTTFHLLKKKKSSLENYLVRAVYTYSYLYSELQ